MSIIYTAQATATGGRDGRAETDSKSLSVPLIRPGASGEGTNPEELFACGYGACFGGALAHIARQKGIDLSGPATVKVDVNLHKDDAGFHISAVLDVQMSGLDDAVATDLVKATHDFCPYSKATRGNIDVALKLNGKDIG
jgi:osmotically inducible protein OsmC